MKGYLVLTTLAINKKMFETDSFFIHSWDAAGLLCTYDFFYLMLPLRCGTDADKVILMQLFHRQCQQHQQ